jgi:hypothetical protein
VTTIDLSVATVEAAVTVPVTGLAAVAVDVPAVTVAAATPATAAVQLQAMPGGPSVIAVPYANWPPADPQPNILYLRLAP